LQGAGEQKIRGLSPELGVPRIEDEVSCGGGGGGGGGGSPEQLEQLALEYRSDQAYLWTRPNVSEIPYHVKLTNPTEDSWWADEDWGKCQCTRKCWEGHSSKMTFPKQAVSLTGITPFLGRVPLKRLFTRQQRDPEDPCCSLTKVKIVTQGHGSLFYLIQGVNVFDWTFQDDVRFTFETACVVPGKVVPLHEALKMQKLKTVPPELAVIRITQFFSSNCLQCGKPGAKRRCSACQESIPGHPRYFYCDKACQKAHWPIHKVVCPKH
jgi:hypothetical protein